MTTTTCFIIPPYLLENLERTVSDGYRRTRELDTEIRARRSATTPQPGPEGGAGPDRIVYDAGHGTQLPGKQIRAEGADPSGDEAVDQAYDGTGATWTMYSEVYQRDSIDGRGLQLVSSVHYGQNYANAFWDGKQMVFGDGDGQIFRGFTSSIDITGHELAHGVTQYTAGLEYQGQPGALNESISDVFGSLVKQYGLNQTADQADWIIGAGIFTEGVNGVGIRSMKEPGTAYDDPRLGKDPQPAHMEGYVDTTDDNGGVHINSGIPNRAFYLTATKLGGNAWEQAGRIWYDTLTGGSLGSSTDFAAFAAALQQTSQTLLGNADAVTEAWVEVGVLQPS